jgi:hypothetical protein
LRGSSHQPGKCSLNTEAAEIVEFRRELQALFAEW